MAEPWATCLPAMEKGDSEISLLGCETVVSPESSGLGQDPSSGPEFQQSRLRAPSLRRSHLCLSLSSCPEGVPGSTWRWRGRSDEERHENGASWPLGSRRDSSWCHSSQAGSHILSQQRGSAVLRLGKAWPGELALRRAGRTLAERGCS